MLGMGVVVGCGDGGGVSCLFQLKQLNINCICGYCDDDADGGGGCMSCI